jgi:signal transduction histidine kinase
MSSQGRSRREQVASHFGSFAFATVIIATYAQLAFARKWSVEPWEVIVVFAGGAVYGSAGVLYSHWRDEATRRWSGWYFVGQSLLLTVLVFLTPVGGAFAILVLPLASQAIFDLRWPWAALVNVWLYAVCVIAIGLSFGIRGAQQALVGYGPAFIFTSVFSVLARRAMAARREAERLSEELAEANAQLRLQSAQAEDLATTRERNRLAREIHDGLGHYLTVINVQLEAARTLLEREPARAAESLAKATRLSREALDEVRRSVADLHHDTALAALPERINALCGQTEPAASCVLEGTPRPLSPAVRHALYRAAQEALTNVRKHAGAAEAELRLDFRDPGRVTLRVSDRGRGDGQVPPNSPGLGLRGMRERVELLGGRVSTAQARAGGFELIVEMPA